MSTAGLAADLGYLGGWTAVLAITGLVDTGLTGLDGDKVVLLLIGSATGSSTTKFFLKFGSFCLGLTGKGG